MPDEHDQGTEAACTDQQIQVCIVRHLPGFGGEGIGFHPFSKNMQVAIAGSEDRSM